LRERERERERKREKEREKEERASERERHRETERERPAHASSAVAGAHNHINDPHFAFLHYTFGGLQASIVDNVRVSMRDHLIQRPIKHIARHSARQRP
jgi:hypothetical protein